MLVLFVAVAVYAVQSRPRPASPPPPARALVPCEPSETLELSITSSGGGDLLVQRSATGAEWTVKRPRPGAADGAAVDGLLGALSSLHATESLKETAPGQDLGLQPPGTTISCSLSGGASYTLSVGGQSFDGNGNYARVSGDAKVHVIPAAEVAKFQKAVAQPPYRPSPTPSGPTSPSPST